MSFLAGGLIGRPEFVTTLVGLGLAVHLGVGLLLSKFPRGPRLVAIGPVFPVVIGPGEPLAGQHRRAGEKEEGVLCDGTARPAGLLLGVLEHINILGDALNLKMVELHLVVHRQEVDGVPAGAPCFQVCKQILGVDLHVNGVWVP